MVELTTPGPRDRYLNLMCGSGTLLIERLLRLPAEIALGLDVSPEAISASRENSDAAGLTGRTRLIRADARATGLPTGSFSSITSDLPYGNEHGSRSLNTDLYRSVLREATRLCRARGCMVLLTQDVASLTAVRRVLQVGWRVIDERRIVQRRYRPLCLTLRRSG
jgi:23S rRNA G2445 N2-methylase RlmL